MSYINGGDEPLPRPPARETSTTRTRQATSDYRRETQTVNQKQFDELKLRVEKLENRANELDSRVKFVNPWAVQHYWAELLKLRAFVGYQPNSPARRTCSSYENDCYEGGSDNLMNAVDRSTGSLSPLRRKQRFMILGDNKSSTSDVVEENLFRGLRNMKGEQVEISLERSKGPSDRGGRLGTALLPPLTGAPNFKIERELTYLEEVVTRQKLLVEEAVARQRFDLWRTQTNVMRFISDLDLARETAVIRVKEPDTEAFKLVLDREAAEYNAAYGEEAREKTPMWIGTLNRQVELAVADAGEYLRSQVSHSIVDEIRAEALKIYQHLSTSLQQVVRKSCAEISAKADQVSREVTRNTATLDLEHSVKQKSEFFPVATPNPSNSPAPPSPQVSKLEDQYPLWGFSLLAPLTSEDIFLFRQAAALWYRPRAASDAFTSHPIARLYAFLAESEAFFPSPNALFDAITAPSVYPDTVAMQALVILSTRLLDAVSLNAFLFAISQISETELPGLKGGAKLLLHLTFFALWNGSKGHKCVINNLRTVIPAALNDININMSRNCTSCTAMGVHRPSTENVSNCGRCVCSRELSNVLELNNSGNCLNKLKRPTEKQMYFKAQKHEDEHLIDACFAGKKSECCGLCETQNKQAEPVEISCVLRWKNDLAHSTQ